LGGTAYSQTGNPFDRLPYHNPQQLREWVSLDDARFQELLIRDWTRVRAELDASFPPGLVIFPLPRSFAGPQQACLNSRVPAACRIYMTDLIQINQQKENQKRAGTGAFASPQ
jgi:hypothetical protein